MLIAGEWLPCDDGVTRPVVQAAVEAPDGLLHIEFFLVDVGADRTIFSARVRSECGFSGNVSARSMALQGIGGVIGFESVRTALQFTSERGPVHFRGEFAVLTDPAATDLSLLGRDVLDNFDVIVSRRRNQVLLLAPNHQYRIERV